MQTFKNKYTSDNKYVEYEVRVLQLSEYDDEKISYIVKLKKDKFLLNIYLKNKYDEGKNLNSENVSEFLHYEYGDILIVVGKIKISGALGNIGEFNYTRYLNSKNIYGTIYAKNVEIKSSNQGNGIISKIYGMKNIVSDKIHKYMRKQ